MRIVRDWLGRSALTAAQRGTASTSPFTAMWAAVNPSGRLPRPGFPPVLSPIRLGVSDAAPRSPRGLRRPFSGGPCRRLAPCGPGRSACRSEPRAPRSPTGAVSTMGITTSIATSVSDDVIAILRCRGGRPSGSRRPPGHTGDASGRGRSGSAPRRSGASRSRAVPGRSPGRVTTPLMGSICGCQSWVASSTGETRRTRC